MKKRMCLFLAALMLCVLSAAMAEDTMDQKDAFSGDWISEDNQELELAIWNEEGAYDLVALWYDSDEKLYSVMFDRCTYDAEKNNLLCKGGVQFLEPDEGEEEKEIVSGFDAVLTVDENGLLHWTGSGEAIADQTFVPWREENDGLFTGEWEYGDDGWISVELHNGVYYVFVELDKTDYEATCWEYTCALDENGMLAGTGMKADFIFDENGDVVDMTQGYDDGKVSFTLNGANLLWKDAVENAGEGMNFERIPEEEDTEDDEEEMQVEVIIV